MTYINDIIQQTKDSVKRNLIMGTGVGEAALIGAAVGGGTALVTGGDPLRGALVGGITGGVGGGISGAVGGAGGAATGATTGATTGTAAGTTAGTVGAGAGATTGTTVALNPAMTSGPALSNTLNSSVVGYTSPANYMPASTNFSSGIASAPAAQTTTQSLVPPEKGFLQKAGDWYGGLSTPGKIGVGIAGGVGLQALTGGLGQPTVDALEEEDNPFGLAEYDREKYRSINPLRHNVYRPSYAAEGGMMKSYAGGGIAALANGGMGNNNMYPQGQMSMTQYATPTQMPTSAEVVNASYEQKTDPYTGSPIGMAEGGEVKRMFMGGNTANPSQQVYYDAAKGQYYTSTDYGPGLGSFIPRKRVYIGDAPSATPKMDQYVPQSAVAPNVYQSGYQDYVEGTPMVTTAKPFKPSPSFVDAYNLLSATAPNIASTINPGALVDATGASPTAITPSSPSAATGMAEGGIAGYNLGGYAKGGKPRLLEGPGDGMSDDIPATIGDRQPARLADGEFVVPADVVSGLGNGSTDAGAKELHSMMDRVRLARTGTKKQGKEIEPEKFLPA